MSTPFYDLASLVVVPSGYKASKVYAQKPLTTDGQLSFSRASTATRVNSAGLIETVSSNVPRLDYLNSSCPRLLLEPQRSNLLERSSELDNAYWIKSAAGVMSANQASSPDGTTTADKWTPNAGTSYASFENSALSTTIGVTYTTSFFAKASGYRYVQLVFDGGDVSGNPAANFDLQTGTVTRQDSGIAASMVSYGNGWYRCIATFVAASTAFNNVIAIVTDPNASRAQSTTYNGTDAILFWGLQMEAGAYATSHIPTASAAVTRLADACSKTGISSLIGQTEGTLFAEVPLEYLNFAEYRGVISVSDGTFNNGVFTFVDNPNGNSNQFIAYVRNNGANEARIAGSNLTTANIGSNYKIAIAYKANDFVFYINGVQIGSDISGSIAGTLSRLDLGSIGYTGASSVIRQSVHQALLFKTRLTNAQLAELTAL